MMLKVNLVEFVITWQFIQPTVEVTDQSVILLSCPVGKHSEELMKCGVLVMPVVVWFVMC